MLHPLLGFRSSEGSPPKQYQRFITVDSPFSIGDFDIGKPTPAVSPTRK
jgi:hypothetical protein